MKRLDLHNHAKISKNFDLDARVFDRYIQRARRAGLDGFALTEHFHASDYWGVYKALFRLYPCRDGIFWPSDDLCILPGAEVHIREGADVIAIGPISELAKLDNSFPRRLSERYFPRFNEFLVEARRYDLIVIGAHMFREQKELKKFSRRDLQRLDALEVNGKDFGTESRLVARANDLGLAVVGGSDTHHVWQLGIRATEFPIEQVSFPAMREALTQRKTTYCTGSQTFLRVRAAKTVKSWRKQVRVVQDWVDAARMAALAMARG